MKVTVRGMINEENMMEFENYADFIRVYSLFLSGGKNYNFDDEYFRGFIQGMQYFDKLIGCVERSGMKIIFERK